MGIKKRSNVNAEFNMSSLTDIIFLLLIFFMLTSTFVKIHPFELPESNSTTVAPTNIVVQIENTGRTTLNNREVRSNQIKGQIQGILRDLKNTEGAAITIVAETGTPFNLVKDVIQVAGDLQMKAILATQPIK